jgi:hypothetical protein
MTFYEWEEWVKKVLEDHLKDNTEILSFIDMNWVLGFSKKIQDWYVNKKNKVNIKKKILLTTDTRLEKDFEKEDNNKKSDENNLIRYFGWKSFYIAWYLYSWKFSYITLKENKYFWVIIEEKDFYNYQKNIFDFMWEHSSETLEGNKNLSD